MQQTYRAAGVRNLEGTTRPTSTSFADDLNTLVANVKMHLTSSRIVQPVVSASSMPEGNRVHEFFELVYRSQSGAIVSVDEAIDPIFDASLPPYVSAVALPETPMAFVPVPEKAIDRVQKVVRG